VGKYKGRVPTAGKQSDEIRRLADSGMTRAAIAQLLRVSERSVYRVLAAGSA
jgi:DNA invertase Pin-like site-specific DNA recombinase